eukprot:689826-Pleurochrysis_carterae.AAC.3
MSSDASESSWKMPAFGRRSSRSIAERSSLCERGRFFSNSCTVCASSWFPTASTDAARPESRSTTTGLLFLSVASVVSSEKGPPSTSSVTIEAFSILGWPLALASARSAMPPHSTSSSSARSSISRPNSPSEPSSARRK